MTDSENSSLLKLLTQFSPFDNVDNSLLEPLAKDIKIRTAKKGICLFENGDYDANEYYLIKGAIKQQARDGRENTIEAGQPSARFPIAHLRPRMYTAKAASDIQYFVISTPVLDELYRSIRENESELMVQEMQQRAGKEGHALIYEFEQELKNGRFVLPSLPEVAVKIRELMATQDYDMSSLAKLVNTDPAIAAKLVKAANSALYRGVTRCDDTVSAISRLGLITTKQLVTSFAILGLFKTKSHLFKDRMKVLWQESVEVAAYSFVLACNLPSFNEEEALLAGLIHSVGEIIVLSYAERFYDLSTNEETLKTTIESLRHPIGEMILSEWGFAEDLITVARDWSNWQRNNRNKFDYCDLVQVAILYSFKHNPGSFEVPDMHDVPAFNKLADQGISSEQISRIITQAQEQIADLRSLFSS